MCHVRSLQISCWIKTTIVKIFKYVKSHKVSQLYFLESSNMALSKRFPNSLLNVVLFRPRQGLFFDEMKTNFVSYLFHVCYNTGWFEFLMRIVSGGLWKGPDIVLKDFDLHKLSWSVERPCVLLLKCIWSVVLKNNRKNF